MNHPKISEFTCAVGINYKLSDRFVNFVLAKTKPPCFDFRCEPAANGRTSFVPDDVDVAYPLWSANADQTLMLVNSAGLRFAYGYHDESDVDIVSTTPSGLLCRLFIALIESEEPESSLQAGADFAGFSFLADCIAFCDANSASYREYDHLIAKFTARIDAKCH